MTSSTADRRAQLSKDLIPLRLNLTGILPLLEANQPDWYGSIYFERKTSKTYTANLKQTQIADEVVTGVVFRIYDGFTLYEEATDELDAEQLKTRAIAFAKRIAQYKPDPEKIRRPYRPPTWAERLTPDLASQSTSQLPPHLTGGLTRELPSGLEEEITSQIPKNPTAKTQVNFGIRFSEDPKSLSAATCFQKLKSTIETCKALAPQQELSPNDLTYVASRLSFFEEESIFIDRESNLSQTLYRLMFNVTLMSGSDRTSFRVGGLGGLEAVAFNESEIMNALKDLKALKSANRLNPGKYRVLFGPALTGVLAHEAFGHAQEADTCARGRSKAWELHQTGERVGNSHATILNNPAIFENGLHSFGAWGSYFFDEEGWLAQKQVLLDEGKLLVPMTNLTSAIRLRIPRTANGKRESWAHGVYTRQTNTYFSAGNKTLSQLMADLGNGFIALHAAGGMEDPKGMGIQVGISFLHEVKAGKLTGNLFKGPAGGDIQMTGYTPDVLNSIIGKSKIDFESEEPDRAKHPVNDVGGCGKYHKEFVFAGCGGPYLLLDQVILG